MVQISPLIVVSFHFLSDASDIRCVMVHLFNETITLHYFSWWMRGAVFWLLSEIWPFSTADCGDQTALIEGLIVTFITIFILDFFWLKWDEYAGMCACIDVWWKQLLLRDRMLFFFPQWHWNWTSASVSKHASSHCHAEDWPDMNIFMLESFNNDNVPNKSFPSRDLNSLISQWLPEQQPSKRFYCASFSGLGWRV